jgi:hypothetical protein
MSRGGFRQRSGRPPDPRALIREAAHMLAGSASILYGVARGDLPTDRKALEEIGRAVARDAMAAKRRIDQAVHRLDFSSSHGNDGRRSPSRSLQNPTACSVRPSESSK